MANLKQTWLAMVGLALASCAPPKAVVVQEAPAPVKRVEAQAVAASGETPAVLQDDGLRMPDLLELPGEGEFRPSSATSATTGNEPGAVISRPPTEPPSRVPPPAPATE
jgi:hypothetical protein